MWRPLRASLVAAFFVLSAVFSFCRLPYDDEWFSFAAASSPDTARVLSTLAGDLHPPWIVFFDRALWHLFHDQRALCLSRLIASTAAITLLSSVAERRLRVPWAALAALQPIVFFYSACARWYPFLLLAQAFRAYALWSPGRRPRAWVMFVLGGIIGPMIGYVDGLFLSIDSAWWLARERAHGRLRSASATLFVLIAMDAAIFVLSPLFHEHYRLLGGLATGGARWMPGLAGWFVTGILGQSFLPGGGMLLALVAVPGLGVAVHTMATEPRMRSMVPWLIAVTLGWVGLTARMALEPRYALMLWFLVAAGMVASLRRRGGKRIASGLAVGYLAFAWLLMVTQRFSLKGDLNRLPVGDCVSVLGRTPVDLVVAPYPGTASNIRTACAPSVSVVTASWGAHYGFEAGDELAPIVRQLSTACSVLLVTVPVRDSSLAETNDAAERLMAASHCARESTTHAVRDPHAALKMRLDPEVSPWRVRSELWTCPGSPLP